MMSRFSIPSLFLILCSTFVYGINTEPVITLNGPNPQYVDSGGVYEELGAVAYDNEDGSLTDQIVISGSVNTNYPGNYTIQYVVTDSDGNSTVMNRTVTVTDQTPPVIILQGNSTVSVEVFNSYTELGAIATDEYDGDLSSSIIIAGTVNTSVVGAYQIVYSVTDSHGNTASVTRTVVVIDSTPPVINLNGATTIYLELGSTYIDPGASATDEYDGDLNSSIIISGTVDTSNVGTYILLYNVSDSSGNTAETSRSVVVEANSPSLEMITVASVTDDGDQVIGAGDTITYTIVIENTGNTTINFISFVTYFTALNGDSLILTSGPTFVSNSNGSTEGTLQPGETSTYVATYVINQSAVDKGGVSIQSEASAFSASGNEVIVISDDPNDSTSDQDPTVVYISPYPSLEIINTAIIFDDYDDGYNGLGDTIEYTIAVENTGNINLSDVYITDNLTALNGDSLILTSGPTFDSNSNGSTEGTLQLGETATYFATYEISQQAVDAGGVSFTAIATASTPNNFEDVVTVSNSTTIVTNSNPSLAVTKEVEHIVDDGDGFNGSGDIIVYTIKVENNGNVTIANISLTDILTDASGNKTDLSADIILTDVNGNSQTSLTALRVGDTATYNLQYTIDQSAADTGSISNTVSVVGTAPDGTEVSDELATPVVVLTNSYLAIDFTKYATITDTNGDGSVGIGDLITYDLVATNTGNDALSSVSITDVLSDLAGNSLGLTSGPIFMSASLGSAEGSLQIGEQATYRATFIINSQAMNAGGVSNTASANAISPSGVTVSDISDDGDDTDGNTENDPTVTTFTSQPIDNENILLNGNVYITKSNGLIIKSGDDCYRIKVNNGNVVAEPVNCEQ